MNKYSIIRLYLKRSESFTARAISLLKQVQLEEGFDKEVDDFREGMSGAGVPDEVVSDQIIDFSSSLADEYLVLTNGIYSAVLTSMYHLWEHDAKELCKWIPRLRDIEVSDGDRPITEQAIQSYRYEKTKDLLVFLGAQESIFDQVNLLRLVANTAKHGAGPSATELMRVGREYYCKLAYFKGLEITEAGLTYGDIGALEVGDIEYFAGILNAFWTELGEQIRL